MSKRKQNHEMDVDGDSSEEETPTLVDVDFDFYNFNADNDYHAINRLLIQLFGADAESLRTADLTDYITKQAEGSGVGSTVKTDEEDGDPYAFLSVVSCSNVASDSVLKRLVDYVLSKTSADPAFQSTLTSLLSGQQNKVGLVLCERLINMPVQVIPPMYRMLQEEMKEAIEDGQPYKFTHYLFISRVYRLTPEEEEAMAAAQRNSKRHKSAGDSQIGRSRDGVYGFHPEDEEIIKHATCTLTYSHTNAPPRDVESVGLDVGGRVMLVPGERFEALVKTIGDVFAVAGSTGRS
ncbi:hypothetical protein HYDPIDRAFT_43276 [Hydnomerulius pinastri MD-312]|uniref:Protein BCP1 n=1 Tax=Hydnomerulius pinastri MD-312 TaxID=994086 RepID=A0A0C9WB79_9AGAM|nr:hypothetical protein HYDPIDRAFT_141384 [Hydnomerulius pinastri MD-312]KIJ60582.1 hypothetical protein HYDPIDRAFT_43276 [Hydnomerulius pinastri MD-312]